MHTFKDFDIKPKTTSFVGDKIPMKRILNVQITVLEYKIEPSIKKSDTKYLTLQILQNDEKRIVFTGSKILMDQIERVPKDRFPFKTTIISDNDYYEFT
jgi:hypothetical protein